MNIPMQFIQTKVMKEGIRTFSPLSGLKMVLENFICLFTRKLLTSGSCWHYQKDELEKVISDKSFFIENNLIKLVDTPKETNEIALSISQKIKHNHK